MDGHSFWKQTTWYQIVRAVYGRNFAEEFNMESIIVF